MSWLKEKIKDVIARFRVEKFGVKTYAQCGEDIVVRFLFNSMGIYRPSYLELGTYHPILGNNTFLFYRYGSRGVCVEADRNLIREIRRYRVEDKILNIGVATGDAQSADFYIFNEPSLNTFSRDEAMERERNGSYKVLAVENVILQSITQIIKENFDSFPDFLSIDIESLDLEVIRTLDFSLHPIPIICVETCTYSENHIKHRNPEIQEYFKSQDYFAYADTYINTIFVNKRWFYGAKQ